MRARRDLAWLLVGSTAIAAGASHSETGVRSGNDLIRDCKAAITLADSPKLGEDYSRPMYCLGFTSGMSDGLRFGRLACMKGEESHEQIARVVVKFLEDHPERLAEPESLLALEAITGAWPCSKSNQKFE